MLIIITKLRIRNVLLNKIGLVMHETKFKIELDVKYNTSLNI